METRKQAIITALRAFVRQRPGMDPRNYDRAGYLSESRRVTQDRHHAETLLAAVASNDGITADMLLEASRSAYSGRLTIKAEPRAVSPDYHGPAEWRVTVDYCTGQYSPTEYRRAVCAVLASALWTHARDTMPGPIGYRAESWAQLELRGKRVRHAIWGHRSAAESDLAARGGSDYGSVCDVYVGGVSAGEWLRTHFRREFGRTIAGRYFQ